MKYAILAALVAVGACTAPAPDTSADEAAIRALIQASEDANNAGSVEDWVALFADDAVYMPPQGPEITTRAGLRGVATNAFGGLNLNINMTLREVVVTGDWAFARTHVDGTATPKAGGDPFPPVSMRELMVLRRTDDGWRIARLLGNVRP